MGRKRQRSKAGKQEDQAEKGAKDQDKQDDGQEPTTKKSKKRLRWKRTRKSQTTLAPSKGLNGKYEDGDFALLIVGDGNLTFSAQIAKAREQGDAPLVCTVLDNKELIKKKYGAIAKGALKILQNAENVQVLYNIDATDLAQGLPEPLNSPCFDCVAFNFPHTGSQRVHENRGMLTSFFASARQVLRPGGRIDVTMNEGEPYKSWGLEELASEEKLALVQRRPFFFADYPGYRHATTLKGASAPTPQLRSATYSFMPIG